MSGSDSTANSGLFKHFSFRKIIANLRRRPAPSSYATPSRAVLTAAAQDFELIYAVGDIHGCVQELRRVMQMIGEDAAGTAGQKLIVFLGDYVDRGPYSAAVIEFLLKPPQEDFTQIALCGNHDADFLHFCRQPLENLAWLGVAGLQTLLSYGLDADHYLRTYGKQAFARAVAASVPGSHIAFLESLPIALSMDGFLFVHAGIRPGVPIDQQSTHDMMWIREPFLSEGPGLPVTVVHGHSPSVEPVQKPGRIGLDTAAYATGKLSVARISAEGVRLLT